MVYSRPIDNEEELLRRIQNSTNVLKQDVEMMQRVQANFLRRIHLSVHENGGHFEHLLKVFFNN